MKLPIKRKALITGITGQDGSYLAELLLKKDYEVHGLVRHVALEDPERHLSRIRHLLGLIKLHSGSLESFPSIFKLFTEVRPDECYHLAAQSFVSYSFDDEFSTLNTNINGTHYVLAALKEIVPSCRFYFAGSSEMFGKVAEIPQVETTRFHPRSAYGISKVAGYDLTRNYREAYGIRASSGILFNHESPRRGHQFVTRKITAAIGRIKRGTQDKLLLGNLETKRDWGHARDYVEAMWKMLQAEHSDDFVVATGETHSVREFAELAFGYAGLDYRDHVAIDPRFYRPAEVDLLIGRPEKARKVLGWTHTVSFPDLIKEMVMTDVGDEGATIHPPHRTGNRHDELAASAST